MSASEHLNREQHSGPQKPAFPSGYGNYSDPSTRDAQRNTDRKFDSQEHAYNEHMKRSQ